MLKPLPVSFLAIYKSFTNWIEAEIEICKKKCNSNLEAEYYQEIDLHIFYFEDYY